jgi:hypothetical protein
MRVLMDAECISFASNDNGTQLQSVSVKGFTESAEPGSGQNAGSVGVSFAPVLQHPLQLIRSSDKVVSLL